jgi:hypothetical protein
MTKELTKRVNVSMKPDLYAWLEELSQAAGDRPGTTIRKLMEKLKTKRIGIT